MSLTPTEERIAGLVAIGQRNDEVAAELDLSPKTVEWHLSRLYRKLGVRSRTELSVLVLKGNPVGPYGPKDEPIGR
jgi:DNA-binding CsgD family transcriptional regulator